MPSRLATAGGDAGTSATLCRRRAGSAGPRSPHTAGPRRAAAGAASTTGTGGDAGGGAGQGCFNGLRFRRRRRGWCRAPLCRLPPAPRWAVSRVRIQTRHVPRHLTRWRWWRWWRRRRRWRGQWWQLLRQRDRRPGAWWHLARRRWRQSRWRRQRVICIRGSSVHICICIRIRWRRIGAARWRILIQIRSFSQECQRTQMRPARSGSVLDFHHSRNRSDPGSEI